MKRFTFLMSVLVLFVLSFTSASAQKIEGTITEFEYNYDTESHTPKQRKISYDKFSVEKVKDNTIIKIKAGKDENEFTLMLSSKKVGKYITYSPYNLLDDPDFSEPSPAAAQFYYHASSKINSDNEEIKKQCIENKIPLESFIEITRVNARNFLYCFQCV